MNTFRVESLDDVWYPLTGNWLFHETPGHAYYDATYVLSKRYDNLRELLAVLGRDYFPLPGGSKDSQENESILYNDFRFALGFYPAVFKGMETEDANFLSYLFELWKSTPRIQLTKLPSDDWEPVLGFDIQKKINGDLVVEEELYPDVVRSWIEEQPLEREQFLTFLGQSELSKNIQNLRHFLQFENSDVPDIDLEAIGSAHLKNTIIGLEKGFIHSKAKVTEIKANSEKHEVVKQIYDLVLPASDAGELPFPVLHSNNNLSFSSWTEQDLFTINTDDWDVLVRQLNLDKISEALNNAPFVYPDDMYMDHLEGLVDILPVQYVYLMQDCFPLDTLSYYQDWSIQNGIRIFRTPALHHEVSLQYNSQKYLIGKIDRNEYVKVNGAEFTSIYYKDKHSLKGLVQLLSENDDDLATAIMELAGIRETLSLVSSQSLLKDDPDNQSVDENSALLKEEYNRQHQQAYREEILARLEGEEKYTYEWVESFIQFLATYDEGSGSDRKRIGFQRVKPFVKENAENTRFFLLEGANSGLAPNIEDQSEYELELISEQGERKNIPVSAVIREGQDLRIIFTSELSQAQNKTLLNAKSIKLAYTPVLNLYRRLQAAFRNKEIIPPWEDFLEAIPPLSFIYGPPGTGKTTLLASQINELHEQNPLVKILVLVPTNKAGDVIARKVIENNENIAVQRLSVAT
ncbi:MAG: AAA family ATPase, partial [Bacteroidetes bacterium]|nr:AAA family ATPase [Bacteroidota bacterium]